MADKTKDADAPKAGETSKQQTPSVGRMVHFVYGGAHVPAIITDPNALYLETGKPAATAQALTVFPIGSTPFTTVAIEDADGANATWHWPEYVPAS